VVALVCVVGLLALTGVYVVWAVGVAVAALIYDAVRHRRGGTRRPAAADPAPASLSTVDS
jgi:hypothetical protein